MRILSGIQPSGKLHIGNYFGMMQKMIRYQEEGELFCFIASYHALTSTFDRTTLQGNILEAATSFLALGLDPDKSVFWVQSDLPEVTELTWLLTNVTSVGLMERSHSYKDKVAKGLTPSMGLFSYPVLMAADILIFQSEKVPVGKDQKQHVEIARDIAERFNGTYGDTFVLPEAEIDTDVATIPGIDGLKMSKSYGNTIEIFMDKPDLKKRVMSIVTDSTPIEEPKNPDTCSVFNIYKYFLTDEEEQQLRTRYTAGGLRYSDVKKELVERIWSYFEPYRERYENLKNDPQQVRNILREGAERARSAAQATLARARDGVGIVY